MQLTSTNRIVSPALEEILYQPIKVLDHGFVRVIDYMGTDASIVQAARVSYGAGTKHVSQDRGLIFYLMRHRHTSTFEMCEIKFHIKLPIFVARQWIRHRTANVNECSARYSILPKEFYLPEREHLAVQSTQNRQGRAKILTPKEADHVLEILKEDANRCYDHYEEMLNEDLQGNTIDESKPKLARELARLNLTLNCYTEWYWKIDLHNLFHFLRLRLSKGSQYEIRVYAEAILDVVQKWVPLSYEAFVEYCAGGTYVSKTGIEVMKKMLAGHKVTQEESGLGKREWDELLEVFRQDKALVN